jgi:acetylornithine aminotransferase
MKLFPVYPLFDIEPVKAQGATLWDKKGDTYLDLYGGHAVISIGHNHPHYVERIKEQLDKIVFYSNSVQNPLQEELAQKLGELSGLEEYALFLCNSGAEANENALKIASFQTQKKKILCFDKAFHGRTSAAVAVTDNPKIQAPLNQGHEIVRIQLNNFQALEYAFATQGDELAGVIIESIQGVGGIHLPSAEFLVALRNLCNQYNVILILDEVQSGYGRSGNFFGFQRANIHPDLITMAKGMGNGFPVGGVLIHPKIEAWSGMLGTTFGGNHLACVAATAVLEVIESENLMDNALKIGAQWKDAFKAISPIKEVRGEGLMLGLEFDFPIKALREKLLFEHHIFTGYSGTDVIRLLPPLNLTKEEAARFAETLHKLTANH